MGAGSAESCNLYRIAPTSAVSSDHNHPCGRMPVQWALPICELGNPGVVPCRFLPMPQNASRKQLEVFHFAFMNTFRTQTKIIDVNRKLLPVKLLGSILRCRETNEVIGPAQSQNKVLQCLNPAPFIQDPKICMFWYPQGVK